MPTINQLVKKRRGTKTKKLGDTTWPEMNFSLYTYETRENALKIKAIIK